MGVSKKEVIQKALNKIQGKVYLEIGLGGGSKFFAIKAQNKIGIDPCLRISGKRRIFQAILNIFSVKKVKFFETTSDKFFDKESKIFKEKIDVALIDGNHTYQQALSDILNCLKHMSPKGIIFVHDCNPSAKVMAFPTSNYEEAKKLKLKGWTGRWCGDVWKAIVSLRSQRKDLNIFILDCDYGLGVITKGKPDNMLGYSDKSISEMSYESLKENRESLLNLKNPDYFDKFLISS